ncbi:MAG: 4-hydroxy-tetrahydrodipicolinate synthase [Clostridia bacterium]|nr:4-hydroxy-tetrahydrodipicolinate synthase [Clostridia bacterium]
MSKFSLFFGAGTALPTPFEQSGELDLESYRKLLRFQLDSGIDALLVCGTTGEAPTLSDDEATTLLCETVRTAQRCVPVIMGVGSNCTAHAAEKARQAEKNGADALLAVTPYYNKCTPEGLVRHYREIASATSLPIIAYTVPSRTGMTIPPSIWGELFAIPNMIGIKDATGDIAYGAQFLSHFGSEICLWSGNDNATLPLLSLGSEGVISVLSNIKPKETSRLCHAFAEGKIGEAQALANALLPLSDALFCEVNPIPVKAALSIMGLCKPYCRMPLTTASESTFKKLERLLISLRSNDNLPSA